MPKVSQQGDPPDDNGWARAQGQQRRQFISPGMRAKCRSKLLLMDSLVVVQIIGAPIACKEGVKDTWREVAEWAAGQLKAHFGNSVEVQYFDLFDQDCPLMPPSAKLPLVLVNNEVLINGSKISVPAIRKRIEQLRL